jgi:hypothetical protein
MYKKMNNLKLTAAFIPCEEGGYTAIIKEMRELFLKEILSKKQRKIF